MESLKNEEKKDLNSGYPRVISRPQQPVPAAPASTGLDRMNRTEKLYSGMLEKLKLSGEILAWRFEAITFRLGHRCNYTPDFLVVTPREIQIHEVKGGYVREDGLVKWKLAAECHPEFRFFLCRYRNGKWNVEQYRYGDSEYSVPDKGKQDMLK